MVSGANLRLRMLGDLEEALTDSEIRGSMTTSEEGFLWFKPGELHREEYRADLTERIPALYGEHGYIDLEVLGDTIVVDEATGKGRIEIRVREGSQYLVEFFISYLQDVFWPNPYVSAALQILEIPIRNRSLADSGLKRYPATTDPAKLEP